MCSTVQVTFLFLTVEVVWFAPSFCETSNGTFVTTRCFHTLKKGLYFWNFIVLMSSKQLLNLGPISGSKVLLSLSCQWKLATYVFTWTFMSLHVFSCTLSWNLGFRIATLLLNSPIQCPLNYVGINTNRIFMTNRFINNETTIKWHWHKKRTNVKYACWGTCSLA